MILLGIAAVAGCLALNNAYRTVGQSLYGEYGCLTEPFTWFDSAPRFVEGIHGKSKPSAVQLLPTRIISDVDKGSVVLSHARSAVLPRAFRNGGRKRKAINREIEIDK